MTKSDSSQGFLVQMFIISPAISWILKPGRFSKRRGFLYAVAFLVVVAAITIGMDLYEQEANFYHVVGVDREAAFVDIKRAFRQRSVELHPDKNPSPTAWPSTDAALPCQRVSMDANLLAPFCFA